MRSAPSILLSTILHAYLLQAGLPDHSADAQRIIERAQAFLGGATAIQRVKSFEYKSDPHTIVRVLLPEYYQIQVTASDPPHVTSFDGTHLWSRRSDGTMQTAASLGVRDERERGLRRVAEYSLMFLVHTTPSYPMQPSVIRDETCGHVAGVCLEFRSEAGSAKNFIEIVFDPADGRPVAFMAPFDDPVGSGLTVWHLSDYQAVDGLKFPRLVSVSTVWQSGRPDQVLPPGHYTDFKVNPSLGPKDFVLGRR